MREPNSTVWRALETHRQRFDLRLDLAQCAGSIRSIEPAKIFSHHTAACRAGLTLLLGMPNHTTANLPAAISWANAPPINLIEFISRA